MKNIFLISVITAMLCCCGCKTEDSMSDAARKYAIADARSIGENANELIKVQEQLLYVRAIETRLRQNGHPIAADIYVETFESTLKEEYPELASEILD